MEEFIRKVYKELNLKLGQLGQHNHIVESKSMWKWCPDCKRKALTVAQPNDQITRFADYRIYCLKCRTTQTIRSNQYSKKQLSQSFIIDLINRFNLEIFT